MGQGASTCFCGSHGNHSKNLQPAGQGAPEHAKPTTQQPATPTAQGSQHRQGLGGGQRSSSPRTAAESTSDSSSGSGWATPAGSEAGDRLPLEAILEHLRFTVAWPSSVEQSTAARTPSRTMSSISAASTSSQRASGKQAPTAAVWDPAAASAVQSGVDSRHAAALDQVAAALTDALATAGAPQDAFGMHKAHSPQAGSQPASNLRSSAVTACTVQHSCLVPYAVQQLHSCSLTDVTQRCRYYCSLLHVLQQLAAAADTRHLLHVKHGSHSVADCLLELVPSAERLRRLMLAELQPPAASRSARAPRSGQGSAAGQKGNKPEADAMQVVDRLLQLGRTIEGRTDQAGLDDTLHHLDDQREPSPAASLTSSSSSWRHGAGDSSSACGCSSSSCSGSSIRGYSARSYTDVLRPLQVQYLPSFPSGHTAATQAEPSGAPRARMVRVLREAAGLEQLLPLCEESSVFVAVSEERATLWKALIVGPMGTPYAGGCFLFDIYFPPQYPNCPPKVTLKTTGGGKVRFNPNLYKDGKVCLSLLDTWYGKKGETWDPAASSALQVLVSIQALILVEEPWYNEPGRDGEKGKRYATNASHTHNKLLRENTIRLAMLDYLKAPPAEFADVIRAHFRMRGPAICGQIKAWTLDSDSAHVSRINKLLSQLQTELDKLGA